MKLNRDKLVALGLVLLLAVGISLGIGLGLRSNSDSDSDSGSGSTPRGSKVPIELENSIFLYSSEGVDAAKFNLDSDAKDVLKKTILKGLTATKAGETTKLLDVVVSKVTVGEATDESGAGISKVPLKITATTTLDPSTAKAAVQTVLDNKATDGAFSTILPEFDPTSKYAFSIISSVSSAAYNIFMTFTYECDVDVDVTNTIQDESTATALKNWQEFVNKKEGQGLNDINVAIANIDTGKCIEDPGRHLSNQQQHGRNLRGTVISKVEYILTSKCTGTCPDQVVPIIETINRNRNRKLVEGYNDTFLFEANLNAMMSKENNVVVTASRTDAEANSQVILLSKSQTTIPSTNPSTIPSWIPSQHPSETRWVQMGQDIDGEAQGDQIFNTRLSADGKIVAIGAPYNDGNGDSSGHVRVYAFDQVSEDWIQMGGDIDGGFSGDESGWTVSLSSDGTKIAIGAPYYNNDDGFSSGRVRVYTYNQASFSWVQLGQDIVGEAEGGYFGWIVSLSDDGTTAAIVETIDSAPWPCRVFSFNQESSSWDKMGQAIAGEGEGSEDNGWAELSADGTTVGIGTSYFEENLSGTNTRGYVRIFKFNQESSSWGQLGPTIEGEFEGDNAGNVYMSDDGTKVAIGAPFNDGNGTNSGHVRVYAFDQVSEDWIQMGGDIDGEASGDESGWTVSLSSDGTKVAIGAKGNDGNGENSGHVRVYTYNEASFSWVQMGQDIDGEASGDESGYIVSLSADGTKVAIPARYNDGNGANSGHVRVYSFG